MFPPLSENGFRELSVEKASASGALEGFPAGEDVTSLLFLIRDLQT